MNSVLRTLFVCVALLASLCECNAQTQNASTKWHWNEGTLVVDCPQRPAGQQHVLGLTAEPLSVARVGFVGLGMRGPSAVVRFCHIPGVEIVALCDYYEENATECQKYLREAGLAPAAIYSGENGYEELCKRDDIDLVYIATDWDHHFPVAKCALQNGKHAAIEVPSAMNLAQCWELIDLSEQTRLHCMILENCCYDYYEMTALNMAQQGLFGEIIHTEGAYIHNLEPFWDKYADNWRMEFNQANGGDVYPTHGFGPCCNVLNIHRGDKLDYLVSMSTESINGKAIAKAAMNVDENASGDHQVTLIMTEKGKCMEVQHNVYTPRPYNRMYQVTGTEGFANKYPIEGMTLRDKNVSDAIRCGHETINEHSFVPDDVLSAIKEEYMHPIHREIGEMAKKVGGHGGMDFVMDYRLIYCLHHGLPLDQDVYDAAEWCCIGELSAVSEANGSMPVRVPDFTRGNWNKLDGLKFYHE